MEIYSIKDLNFAYPQSQVNALNRLTFTVSEGDFITICGKSGCGKSTLLHHLKTVLTPHGSHSGEILFCGKPLEQYSLREQASQIGFVMQNGDEQIVTDKVWHELAFGLESLGFDNKTIRLRVAEMASFFGIEEWFTQSTTKLSGGQKQIINLASVMVMQPKVLILDEPTSQLDPIAAVEFLQCLKKINNELGTTIIISEHRLEELFPISDKIAVLDKGTVLCEDTPILLADKIRGLPYEIAYLLPTAMKIYRGTSSNLPCPITVKDGRRFLSTLFAASAFGTAAEDRTAVRSSACHGVASPRGGVRRPVGCGAEAAAKLAVSMKDVWFRYEKNGKDVVKDLSLEIKKGSIHAVMGGNGAGKTTVLNLISGVNKAYRGKIKLEDKEIGKYSAKELYVNNIGVLPQNPQALFVKDTVELDLMDMLDNTSLSAEEKRVRIDDIAKLTEISDKLPVHPYDLSGGEQQRAALAKILLFNPKLLLLDEPTKGIDGLFKVKLADILKKLCTSGVTIVMVSHDVEFCAEYSDMCSMLFNGEIITTAPPKEFFGGNSFYTTAANKMSRHLFQNAVTNEEVIALCMQSPTEQA